MEAAATVIFVIAVLIIGIGHLKFSERISEDLIKQMKFRK